MFQSRLLRFFVVSFKNIPGFLFIFFPHPETDHTHNGKDEVFVATYFFYLIFIAHYLRQHYLPFGLYAS